jgi:hypothetical protein
MAAAIGNQYALGNKGGSLNLKFPTVEGLQSKIDAFFDSCYEVDEETGKKVQVEPFTITGLALALDTSREVLMDIQNRVSEGYTKEHSDCLLRAKLKCHNYAEKQLFTAKSPQGSIFALKQYGWKDVQIVENTGPNGGPLLIQAVNAYSDEDLKAMEEIMARSQQISGEIVDI